MWACIGNKDKWNHILWNHTYTLKSYTLESYSGRRGGTSYARPISVSHDCCSENWRSTDTTWPLSVYLIGIWGWLPRAFVYLLWSLQTICKTHRSAIIDQNTLRCRLWSYDRKGNSTKTQDVLQSSNESCAEFAAAKPRQKEGGRERFIHAPGKNSVMTTSNPYWL